ncbi:uncharacterized protein LOC128994490 [Macrosteles quadrilineatus]|uniref:uncharacterized protein LOC128994490 n=1 Tax=Macrosteles quadrilineatus TaxID=74068 RepID=UPI0023E2909D|nr:uncharacterized protein LOC128994490 [Macrosteles quadrilineatus]
MPGTSRKTRVKRHLTLSTKRKRSTAKNLDKWRERKRNICLVSASECQSNATVFHDLPKTDESGITSKHNTVMSEMNNNDEIIESTDTSFVRLSECQISDSFHHSTPKDHDIISKKDNVTEAEPTGILNNDDLPDAGRETITIRRNDSLDSDSDDSDWLAGIELLAPRDEEDNEDIAKEISIHGRRIVNIDHFIKSLQSLENHEPFDCKFSDMYLINDRRIGLIDELTFHCKVEGMRYDQYRPRI